MNQDQAFQILSMSHVLLTGAAGSGKTYFMTLFASIPKNGRAFE